MTDYLVYVEDRFNGTAVCEVIKETDGTHEADIVEIAVSNEGEIREVLQRAVSSVDGGTIINHRHEPNLQGEAYVVTTTKEYRS